MHAASSAPRTSPVGFLGLVGHPLRWRLLAELAHSDLKVRELAALIRERQGLVSYHLGRLRSARLVSMRRSSADGRDAYYALDLSRFGDLLTATAESLHPGLQFQRATLLPASEARAGDSPVRVLFLCTGNSARSQMAEALIERVGGGQIVAFSAGSEPKRLHPNAVRAMEERGIDISNRRTKSLDEFRNQHFDIVVTLCDRLRERCPEFPGGTRVVHWSLPDPSDLAGSDEETYPAFTDIAADLATRIHFLLLGIQANNSHQEVRDNA